MKNTIIITIAVAILVGGISFFAGTKYQESKQPVFNRQFGQGQAPGQASQGQRLNGNTNRMGFRPVNGEIISADEKTITVKLTDGSSKIVVLSESTEINKANKGTQADLIVGEKVAVIGSDNTDGSVTAQNIQLNPVIRAMPDNVPTGSQPSP